MQLERAKQLLNGTPDTSDPRALMIEVLAASIELVLLEDNNFLWSSWQDAATAEQELASHMESLKSPQSVNIDRVSVLFAPTGPMQELSLSSGWGEPFIKLASYFDVAAAGLRE